MTDQIMMTDATSVQDEITMTEIQTEDKCFGTEDNTVLKETRSTMYDVADCNGIVSDESVRSDSPDQSAVVNAPPQQNLSF